MGKINIMYVDDRQLEKFTDKQEAEQYMNNNPIIELDNSEMKKIYDDLKGCPIAISLLKPMVDKLPSLQRKLVRLRFWENKNYDEIGYELGLTRRKVQSLLEKSFTQIREELVSELYEEVPITA
ncbi:MAG: hypothetical protein HOO06_09540 [Bdellovibrionaceae bacterium]|jgi:DNA-directed RNA polymerase specialized sigma subunit|nr:hypothetical protein [Pseudobdellovibrionaceae bacterium]